MELAALTDPDYTVRLAAVVEVADRAADEEVFAALGARLDDEDLAVIEVAAAALSLYAGAEGLERVLRAYASSEDNSIYALDNAVVEACWYDLTVDSALRSIARRTPQDDVSRAAVEIIDDMWPDPVVGKTRPVGFIPRIINALRRA
jgi:hypothetical protein